MAQKIIIPVLAIAMGVAFVGSVSGTIAWYQFSTRTSTTAAGVTAGVTEHVYISDGTPLRGEAIVWNDHINLGTSNFRPVSYTTGGTFYEQPVYKTPAQSAVSNNTRVIDEVSTVAYAEYNLVFACEDNVNGTVAAVTRNVYLSAFSINYTTALGTADITPAVRVLISGTHSFLIATSAGTTNTHGPLDLNSNSVDDKDGVLVDDSDGSEITYYAGEVDSSYDTVLASSALVTTTDAYVFENKTDKELATTGSASNKNIEAARSNTVNIKIWLEGWALLNSSAIWTNAYFAQNFSVNMQFACEAVG